MTNKDCVLFTPLCSFFRHQMNDGYFGLDQMFDVRAQERGIRSMLGGIYLADILVIQMNRATQEPYCFV